MMRNGVTLIELIFSMVIVAIVFSIVPKIIFASNKAMSLSIKEDGLFNALTLTNMIYKLPWDPNTIDSNGKILHTNDKGNNDCNRSTGYRIGGFKGSRNCIDSEDNTTDISDNNGATSWENINDYNGSDTNQTQGREYNLSVSVRYIDMNVNITTTNGGSSSLLVKHNIKEINTTVKGGKKMPNFQSSFFYDSANLGYININRRSWQ